MRNRLNNDLIWLVGLTGLGLILRLVYLGGPEFWYDEAFTALLARLPINRMMLAIAGDTHPPLYYLIMWGWSRIAGYGEFSIRLVSVLAGAAAIPLTWMVTERLELSRNTRWAVVIVMALGPFELYFSQEARMYTLLQLAYLWAVLALNERKPLQLALANLAMLYLHNYGLFYVATLSLLALWQDRRLTAQIVVAFGLPVLAFIPWIAVLLFQMGQISGGYWIEPITFGSVIYTLTIFLFGPFVRQWVMIAVMVTSGAIVYAVVSTPPRLWMTNRLTQMLYWLAFGPILLAVLASVLWRPVFLFRGLIGCMPFFLMLIFQPLADLPGWRRVYAAALIVPLLAIGMVGYWSDINGFKSTTLEAIEAIRAEWQPGDILYSTNDGNWVMFTMYQDQPVYLMPQCEDHDRGALSALTRQALGVPVASVDRIPHRRIWLLWNWGGVTSMCNHDRAAQLVGVAEPWLLVEEDNLQFAGIYRLE